MANTMESIAVAEDLHLIPLDQNLRGFTHFIGAWLYQREQTYLVDVGPAATVPHLTEALNRLGITAIDAILLTHIHLDHAGGIGHMAKIFPDARIFVHEAGIPHLSEPDRLWEGSLKTLGDTARQYGQILPVPAHRLTDARNALEMGVRPLITPGHASHHVSYRLPPYLFLGEAGGVCRSLGKGYTYLRPATPPKFFLETTIASLDALIALRPDTVCYGHYGIRMDGVAMLEAHRAQLLLWEQLMEGTVGDGREDPSAAALEMLLLKDPCLSALCRLPGAEQERERFFLLNSIKGYAGHLERQRQNRT